MLGRDVAEPAALVADEEERDDLEDALALPVEPVADVTELPERVAVGAGLLGDLAERGLLAALARVDPPLRERPGARPLPRGRIAAIIQRPLSRRTSTPPAENSRLAMI